jgi:hypothetical protein
MAEIPAAQEEFCAEAATWIGTLALEAEGRNTLTPELADTVIFIVVVATAPQLSHAFMTVL